MLVKDLIIYCFNHVRNHCEKCEKKLECNIFYSRYNTTPYLMNKANIAEDYDFDYHQEKDKEI